MRSVTQQTECVQSFALVWTPQTANNATIIETIEQYIQSQLLATSQVLNWFITRVDTEGCHIEGNYLS